MLEYIIKELEKKGLELKIQKDGISIKKGETEIANICWDEKKGRGEVIFYITKPKYRKKGFGTIIFGVGLGQMIEYNISRVCGWATSEISKGIMEKYGLKQAEKSKIKCWLYEGKLEKSTIYSVLRKSIEKLVV